METVNHECYVSLEVAKLLKEAGFDWRTNKFYSVSDSDNSYVFNDNEFTVDWNNNDSVNSIHAQTNETYYSTPTLEVAQRWLREVKRCIVEVNYDDCQKHYWVELFINEDDGGGIPFYGNVFAMFEEAQEAGIKKALEIILEKGE